MGILSTLWLVFKGDNKDALSKAKETEDANNKIVTSVNKTTRAGKLAERQFINIGKALSGLALSAFSTASIVSSISGAVQYAQQLDLVSRQLRVNVGDLDTWINAVKRSGGTAQTFETSLKSLSEHFGVTYATGLKLLPLLADSFQKIGAYRSQNLGKALGLDQSLILTLQQGSRELNTLLERERKLGQLTKQDAEISRNFNLSMQDTALAFRSVWLEIADSVLPYLQKFNEAILIPTAMVFHEHKNLIVGGLLAIGSAAIYAAFALGVLSLPVILTTAGVIALIALFAILYDDVKGFFEGQDSWIGSVINSMGRLIDKVKEYLSQFPSFRHLLGVDEFQGSNPEFGARYLPPNPDDLQTGKDMLNFASNNSLNALPSSSILASQSSSTGTVNIAEINIQTQATDADQIGGALEKGIRDHIRFTTDLASDGNLI